jgi:hypothetical protein
MNGRVGLIVYNGALEGQSGSLAVWWSDFQEISSENIIKEETGGIRRS